MRAGLLSSPETIKLLNEKFVCSWALPSTVDRVSKEAASKEIRTLAHTAIKDFRPLVELFVYNQEGVLVTRKSANEDLLVPLSDPAESLRRFLAFLNETATSLDS